MATSFELAGHVVGIMIDQDVTSGYLEEIHALILQKLKEHKYINLFCEIMPGNKVGFKTAFQDLIFKSENSKKILKIAFVSDLAWLRTLMDVNNIFSSSEIKTFEFGERLDAIRWISQ